MESNRFATSSLQDPCGLMSLLWRPRVPEAGSVRERRVDVFLQQIAVRDERLCRIAHARQIVVPGAITLCDRQPWIAGLQALGLRARERQCRACEIEQLVRATDVGMTQVPSGV